MGAHFGGLRGGDARLTKHTVVLDRYSYVPGVALSGTISTELLLKSKGPQATLAVSAVGASGGQLRLGVGHRFSGVLGGHAFSVRLTARTASARSTEADPPEWPAPGASLPLPALARLR